MKFKRGDFCMCIGGCFPELLGRTFTLAGWPPDGEVDGEPGWLVDPPQWIGAACIVFAESTLMLIRDADPADVERETEYAHG